MTMTAQERYQTDPQFRTLVEMMYKAIISAKFTPTEMREAAILASIKYEMSMPHPSILKFEMFNSVLNDERR